MKREYSIKPTWYGLVVMVRYLCPDIHGDYCWTKYEKATFKDLKEVIRRMM